MDSPAPSPPAVSLPSSGVLGTRLRFLFDQLEAGVAAVYTDLGLPGFRTRYNPIVRVLTQAGPRSIRDLAAAIGVTHSAVSQTVAQMAKDDLVTLAPGQDARQRIVSLTPKAEELLPLLEAEWDATLAAAEEFDAELPFPLTRLVEAALEALDRRPMHDRIAARLQHPQRQE
ncbi:MAG TPA: MarR family transcriptional regulator [Actinocrinis sp.]|nr:MarR family transcriptional regulator [Actinocrinis sp.]